MSEPNAGGAKERTKPLPPERSNAEPSSGSGNGDSSQITGALFDLTREATPGHSLYDQNQRGSHEAPLWLQPFFSLRVQLTFAFFLILSLSVAVTPFLISQHPSSLYGTLIMIGAIILGTSAAFLLITVLLRPLWRVTDAAQAIAVGDLEQRDRLPLRLPPQDEIDRLAGSLDAMVTRLERAEEMRRSSEELFRRFFSDASHQLRTPLTSIRGFTELLLRGAKDDPEMTAHILKRMKNESERMTTLINDLLTISRLNDSHLLKLQYLDMVELAVEGIEQTRTRAGDERKISLVISTQERLGMQADRDRIKQLLFILLDNALKHGRSAPDGCITLELAKQDRQIVIRIIDNGEGISQDDLEHIGDAFYRGRHHSSRNGARPAGAGLGLTIASAIVRAHNGTIAVKSEVGRGTEFEVKFPCVD